MNHVTHKAIFNFIWGVADDVLRDVYVRGKYLNVILDSAGDGADIEGGE